MEPFLDLSRDPRPAGSGRPFGWGKVRTPIRPITGRRSLSPASFTPTGIGDPCGSLSTLPMGPLGLTTFRTLTTPEGVRFRLSAGSTMSARSDFPAPRPDCVPFWFMPVSPFGMSSVTTVQRRFTWVNRAPHPWLPTALGLAVATEPRGVVARPRTEASLSRALRTPGLPPTHGPIGD